eukprot:CAMPEP_0168610444 /NCGR_PEP_ID=MMETSP0449_2-20121227/1789_1 /TAXON_ID=1082188 /ORGANISM="Strombidium rassoulzadegani, Strain ras09" /LENGTH=179 /DNA_ID=CAMNT_0008650747 /DNA_START=14 /DNA_END=553 /DNA_ORIENTATION=+
MSLQQDLENYANTRNPEVINDICRKMEQSEEVVNGRRRINSNVISAVVLYLAKQRTPTNQAQRFQREILRQITLKLNDETRLCFLNAIVNELRYPSLHTFNFSCNILLIYSDSDDEKICKEVSQIILERLQAKGPHPWGLLISFRELIQNRKFNFLNKEYIKEHPQAIMNLFEDRLKNF